jgi:hypothetical protein
MLWQYSRLRESARHLHARRAVRGDLLHALYSCTAPAPPAPPRGNRGARRPASGRRGKPLPPAGRRGIQAPAVGKLQPPAAPLPAAPPPGNVPSLQATLQSARQNPQTESDNFPKLDMRKPFHWLTGVSMDASVCRWRHSPSVSSKLFALLSSRFLESTAEAQATAIKFHAVMSCATHSSTELQPTAASEYACSPSARRERSKLAADGLHNADGCLWLRRRDSFTRARKRLTGLTPGRARGQQRQRSQRAPVAAQRELSAAALRGAMFALARERLGDDGDRCGAGAAG